MVSNQWFVNIGFNKYFNTRQIQQNGMATEHRQRGSFYRIIRKILSFPFLPDSEITTVLDHLSVGNKYRTEEGAMLGRS